MACFNRPLAKTSSATLEIAEKVAWVQSISFNRPLAKTSSATTVQSAFPLISTEFQSPTRENLFCNFSKRKRFLVYYMFQSPTRENLFCNVNGRHYSSPESNEFQSPTRENLFCNEVRCNYSGHYVLLFQSPTRENLFCNSSCVANLDYMYARFNRPLAKTSSATKVGRFCPTLKVIVSIAHSRKPLLQPLC